MAAEAVAAEPAKEPEVQVVKPVVLEWEDLKAGKDLSAQVKEAFGNEGIGLLAVSGVPGVEERRQALLPLSQKIGQMPAEVLAKYERPDTDFCMGWSCGKEKFKGKPDVAKGSWYGNPLYDDPSNGDEEARKKYPWGASEMIWPEEVPELREAFRNMGQLLNEVAQPIVKQCDDLIRATYPEHGTTLFDKTFKESRMLAGRLLHYYPGDTADWCGWHNDNSTITGLVPAMFMNDETKEEIVSLPTDAGLYAQGRDHTVVKVAPPKGCLMFQVGESAQILSGGVLHATPHYVKGHLTKPGETPVSRETFALFMQPQWDSKIGPPPGAATEDILKNIESELIPPLSSRFCPEPDGTVEFGKLLGDSFKEYYKHNNAEEEG